MNKKFLSVIFAGALICSTGIASASHLKLDDYPGTKYLIQNYEEEMRFAERNISKDPMPREAEGGEVYKPKLNRKSKFRPGFVYWQEKECWINIHAFPAVEKQERALVLYHPTTRLGIVINFRSNKECNMAMNIILHGHDCPLPPYAVYGVDSDPNQGRCNPTPVQPSIPNIPNVGRDGQVVPVPQYFDESAAVY